MILHYKQLLVEGLSYIKLNQITSTIIDKNNILYIYIGILFAVILYLLLVITKIRKNKNFSNVKSQETFCKI